MIFTNLKSTYRKGRLVTTAGTLKREANSRLAQTAAGPGSGMGPEKILDKVAGGLPRKFTRPRLPLFSTRLRVRYGAGRSIYSVASKRALTVRLLVLYSFSFDNVIAGSLFLNLVDHLDNTPETPTFISACFTLAWPVYPGQVRGYLTLYAIKHYN